MKSLASDNYSGACSEVMKALQECNKNHAQAYGADKYTKEAITIFQSIFGEDIEVFFVLNGTAANVLGLQQINQSYHSIICSDISHMNVDEAGAPEKHTGCKLQDIPSQNGKISAEIIEKHLIVNDFEHASQTKTISITQSTEYGTVYSIGEIKQISKLAKKNNLYLHMDGARICNAAVSLDASFRSFTKDLGVDVLSFGGTKNGLMFGEAIIFLNPRLAENFKYIRKQGLHLASKMRFIAAQFSALLTHDVWKKNASHANQMAKYLERSLAQFSALRITQKVESNALFVEMPEKIIPKLQKVTPFYTWNETANEVRLMCSFDTTETEIDGFVARLKEFLEIR